MCQSEECLQKVYCTDYANCLTIIPPMKPLKKMPAKNIPIDASIVENGEIKLNPVLMSGISH
jgi:hypothetical protein